MNLVQNRREWVEKAERVQQPIRVLLIDPSVLTRRGIKDFFSRSHHIDIIGMAGTRQEALQAIQVEQPNVVLAEV